VRHIEYNDVLSAARNIALKILKAANTPEISEDFMYMADDHYMIRDVDMPEYPYYSNGMLKDLIGTQKNGYREIIKNTLRLFDNPRNFNIHCPIVYNKTKVRQLVEKFDLTLPLGYLFKTAYCNHYGLYEGKELKDCKIRQNFHPDEIGERIGGRDCFSTGDEWRNPNINKYLARLFPHKSRYE